MSRTMYGSYEELRKARSQASLQSSTSASLLGTSPSTSSIGSQNSLRWEEHVRMTSLRMEKIRLQNEATRLRTAFVSHDQRLTGAIPSYMLAACLKAGGSMLPESEMHAIYARFKTSDGQFGWLRFCEGLEKGRGDQMVYHPRVMGRPTTAHIQRNTSVSAKFSNAKASRRSLAQSASSGSLGSSGALSHGSKVNRMRRMITDANLAADSISKKEAAKAARRQGDANWLDQGKAGRPRTADSRTADPIPKRCPPRPQQKTTAPARNAPPALRSP